MTHNIGFIQGRLSPIVNGAIQAFPWDHWKEEFSLATEIGLNHLEWTLDQENLYQNPLMTPEGQKEILYLCNTHKFSIPSLTGDCFMQAPFWKTSGEEREQLKKDFLAIAESCSKLNITFIVVPLVDNGSIESEEQEKDLIEFLKLHTEDFDNWKVKIIFESDLTPEPLLSFISKLPVRTYGINYDTGNSAALGYKPLEEIGTYGDRIYNVHIKDRVLGGTTVPLGNGNTNFKDVFKCLKDSNYNGNFILQTARADDEKHQGVLNKYHQMTKAWIQEFFQV